MANPVPISHVEEAHKLISDAEITLYELYPLSGGTLYFKAGSPVEWLGNEYEGIPVVLNGEKYEASSSTPTPRMIIGQEDMDLLPFKGLINDGYLDGARIVRHVVLLEDILESNNIKQSTFFRVKRIESYSRSQIRLVVSSFSGATNQTFPYRQYVPPAFPWVEL